MSIFQHDLISTSEKLTFNNESHDQFPDSSSDSGPGRCVRVLMGVSTRGGPINSILGGDMGGNRGVVVTEVSGVSFGTVFEQLVDQLISRHPCVLVEVSQQCCHS